MIDWTEPADNGSPILSYKIYIQTAADPTVFAIDETNCDASLPEIRDAKQCTVPVSTLMLSPYSFDWGASIRAYVVATNLYGDSENSELGNGAILMTEPDSPINLAEDESLRTATSISFTWDEGASNGGDSIIDYRISFAQESSVYTVLAVGVTAKEYTATGPTAGLYYKFKVEARNYLYYSLPSSAVQILCATIPEVPNTPTSTNSADYVVVDWEAPTNNGIEISLYSIKFRQSDNTYTEDATYCLGSDPAIVANQ